MRLSRLNPASYLFGPIFQKEVRSAGRRRATYLFRAIYALTLLLLVALAFQGLRQTASHLTGVQRLQMLQQLAPQLGLIIMWFQFVALALAAPIFSGSAICDERRARSLGTLLTTPLTASQIVGGKLSSRVVQLTILALLAAPLLLAIRVFGGLDARIILASTAVSLSTAFLGAALALMYSTWHRRATGAAVFGLLTLVLIQGAPTAIEGILFYVLNDYGTLTGSGPNGSGLNYPFHMNVLATCSPATMAFLTESAVTGTDPPEFSISWPWAPGGVMTIAPMWMVNSAYNLVIAGLASIGSTVALRRVMRREGATEGGPAVVTKPRKKTAAPPEISTVEVIPAEPPADTELPGREAREVSDRPVLWREIRQSTFGSRKRFIGIAIIAAAGMAWLYIQWGMRDEGLHTTLAILGAITIMVQPVFMTTGSIAGEREARTWEVLLTAPVSARDVIFGKMAGALRAQWFLPAIAVLHFVAAAVLGFVHPVFVVFLIMIYAGPTIFFTASGQLFSLMFRKGVTAAACNLGLALLVWAGTWVGLGLAGWFGDFPDSKVYDYAGALAYSLNPVAMSSSAGEATFRFAGLRVLAQTYHIYGMREFTLDAWGFGLICAGTMLLYILGAAGALWMAIAGFNRFGGRAS
jgi:ABC-type transport system involved in multi-copper enzyme maturation permease subunit